MLLLVTVWAGLGHDRCRGRLGASVPDRCRSSALSFWCGRRAGAAPSASHARADRSRRSLSRRATNRSTSRWSRLGRRAGSEFADVHGRALARDFWTFTAARAVAGAVVMIWRRFDVLLVACLAGPADAAVYTAATRFLVVGQLGIQAVQMTVSPQFGRLFARSDLDGRDEVYRTATMWTMTFAWPLYIVTGAAVGLVIPVFGADYDAGAKVTIILSAAMLVATACGGVDAVLLMSGRSWLSLGNAAAHAGGQRRPRPAADPASTASSAPRSATRRRSPSATCSPCTRSTD